jgi:type II secretory pathway pseudopilin PulG
MKKTLIPRSRIRGNRTQERGITMLLVALAMVAIIGMAALSIDVITLYLAREEAQHSADSAALGAAKVLSLSGITGDPTNLSGNWGHICGPDNGTNGLATRVAKAIATQNTVGGAVPTTINVTYSAGSASSSAGTSDCTSLNNTAFGINPVVTVQIIRTGVPNFFSRVWGSTGTPVSATASAEAFNSSNSASVAPSGIIPVQPRCVKPWIVPNLDPLNPSTTCTTNCQPFVSLADGHIINPGMSVNGGNATGVIGERFLLIPDCRHSITANCTPRPVGIQANHAATGGYIPNSPPPNLEYLPGQTLHASAAVASGASAGSQYEQAIGGCDQTTVYYCGVPSASPIGNGPNMVDLGENPASTNGVLALVHEGNPNGSQPDGQDSFSTYGNPPSYPFQIFPGSGNPTGLANTIPITASNSVVSIPIYDQVGNTFTTFSATPVPVTIVGFLQVFINAADQYGNVDVTVLNVAGCGNGNTTPVGTAITANSPVPVRLITPP